MGEIIEMLVRIVILGPFQFQVFSRVQVSQRISMNINEVPLKM